MIKMTAEFFLISKIALNSFTKFTLHAADETWLAGYFRALSYYNEII